LNRPSQAVPRRAVRRAAIFRQAEPHGKAFRQDGKGPSSVQDLLQVARQKNLRPDPPERRLPGTRCPRGGSAGMPGQASGAASCDHQQAGGM